MMFCDAAIDEHGNCLPVRRLSQPKRNRRRHSGQANKAAARAELAAASISIRALMAQVIVAALRGLARA